MKLCLKRDLEDMCSLLALAGVVLQVHSAVVHSSERMEEPAHSEPTQWHWHADVGLQWSNVRRVLAITELADASQARLTSCLMARLPALATSAFRSSISAQQLLSSPSVLAALPQSSSYCCFSSTCRQQRAFCWAWRSKGTARWPEFQCCCWLPCVLHALAVAGAVEEGYHNFGTL